MSTLSAPASGGQGFSYSKWDRIVDSDDEANPDEGPLKPLLHSTKGSDVLEADNELTKRFMVHMKKHKKVPIPRSMREVVARFIAATDKRDQASNTYRYADLVSFSQRVSVPAT